jgi:hypothetical protein
MARSSYVELVAQLDDSLLTVERCIEMLAEQCESFSLEKDVSGDWYMSGFWMPETHFDGYAVEGCGQTLREALGEFVRCIGEA